MFDWRKTVIDAIFSSYFSWVNSEKLSSTTIFHAMKKEFRCCQCRIILPKSGPWFCRKHFWKFAHLVCPREVPKYPSSTLSQRWQVGCQRCWMALAPKHGNCFRVISLKNSLSKRLPKKNQLRKIRMPKKTRIKRATSPPRRQRELGLSAWQRSSPRRRPSILVKLLKSVIDLCDLHRLIPRSPHGSLSDPSRMCLRC